MDAKMSVALGTDVAYVFSIALSSSSSDAKTIPMGRSSSVGFRLLRFWKARIVRRSGELMGVIVINGQFPEPLLNATTNCNVVVRVFYHLDEALLLTWRILDSGKELGMPDRVLINGKGSYKYNNCVPDGIDYLTTHVEPRRFQPNRRCSFRSRGSYKLTRIDPNKPRWDQTEHDGTETGKRPTGVRGLPPCQAAYDVSRRRGKYRRAAHRRCVAGVRPPADAVRRRGPFYAVVFRCRSFPLVVRAGNL
ncbi:hypothetical protein Bca52824_027444 [Brassica carinata]|uniref:Plastocyanin-like domain-containing protein n=1 Tax=Brassica carinata TaxID=52824 RepID=A0A8X7VAI1_BRACI|nr:hypothetical protein Bca52824_027444 [Brassica carinata]